MKYLLQSTPFLLLSCFSIPRVSKIEEKKLKEEGNKIMGINEYMQSHDVSNADVAPFLLIHTVLVSAVGITVSIFFICDMFLFIICPHHRDAVIGDVLLQQLAHIYDEIYTFSQLC